VPTHCVRGARAALTAQGVRATAADDAADDVERCWRPASRRGEEPAYRGGAASLGSSWRAWVYAVIGASAAIAVSPLPYPPNEMSAEHLPYRRPRRHRLQLSEAVVCLRHADLSHHGRRCRRPPPRRCAGRPARIWCGPQHPSAAPRRRYPALIWLRWGLFACRSRQIIQGCRPPIEKGVARNAGINASFAFTPDASHGYGAQWTRDFAYTIAGGAPGLMDAASVKAAVRYTFAGMRADGCVPDRVQVDGASIYSPGGGGWRRGPELTRLGQPTLRGAAARGHRQAWPDKQLYHLRVRSTAI
jgi:hypothetical protein